MENETNVYSVCFKEFNPLFVLDLRILYSFCGLSSFFQQIRYSLSTFISQIDTTHFNWISFFFRNVQNAFVHNYDSDKIARASFFAMRFRKLNWSACLKAEMKTAHRQIYLLWLHVKFNCKRVYRPNDSNEYFENVIVARQNFTHF